jgi:DNA-binding transcriptional regulator YiaG
LGEAFGKRLAAARRAHIMEGEGRKVPHMTQKELAIVLLIDIDTIRKYERSRRLPHPLIRRELLKVFPNLFS